MSKNRIRQRINKKLYSNLRSAITKGGLDNRDACGVYDPVGTQVLKRIVQNK